MQEKAKKHILRSFAKNSKYRKSSIKPPGGLIFSSTFEGRRGGLIERGAYLI